MYRWLTPPATAKTIPISDALKEYSIHLRNAVSN